MFERLGWLAGAGVTVVYGALAGLAGACTSSTDSSGDNAPGQGMQMQMPVGTGGTGMMLPMAGGSPVVSGMAGNGSAAGSSGGMAGTTASAGSTAPQAGSDGTSAMAAGAGGAGGSQAEAGSMAEAGAGGSEAPHVMHEDLGMGDGKDVITIGDSWMNLITVGIEQSLEKVSKRDYRNYSVPGTLVLNEQIPDMYESAKQENKDIKTVVMTGGGNDILTSGCSDTACNSIVDDVSARLTKLLQEMGTDKVEDVVLIGYTYPDDMTKRESLDHSRMLSGMLCNTASMPRCHYIDSTMLDIKLRDGIHPDDAGYDLIGKTVWELMQKEGVRR